MLAIFLQIDTKKVWSDKLRRSRELQQDLILKATNKTILPAKPWISATFKKLPQASRLPLSSMLSLPGQSG